MGGTGFTKSEECDVTNRLLADFKEKVNNLISENSMLKERLNAGSSMRRSRGSVFAGVEDDDDALNDDELAKENNELRQQLDTLKQKHSSLVPCFSSEIDENSMVQM